MCVVCCEPKVSRRFPLLGEILVLVPRFDREFVMTFQGNGLSEAKMAPNLNLTFFSTKICSLMSEFLGEFD